MTDLSIPPIRFGLQINPGPDEIASVAAEAEAAGFDVITVADHVGPNSLSPMAVLGALAAASSTIRLGTMVLNNDMRNPVQLAWESLSLHRLSEGRFELGLGAGHTPHEYAETGLSLDRAVVRKHRLCEAVEIIAGLTAGQTVTHGGVHYHLEGAVIAEADNPPDALPILVGGNGTALLTHAASHADIIGLQGLGRTLEDGHRHTVRWTIDHLESQLAVVADASAAAGRTVELAALVQQCEVSEDREATLAPLVERAEGLTMDDALATPYLAVGTVDEMARHFISARDRWGISYFTVRNRELGPVIARVRELEG